VLNAGKPSLEPPTGAATPPLPDAQKGSWFFILFFSSQCAVMARGVALVKSPAFGQQLLATLAFFLLPSGGAGKYHVVRCSRHHRFLGRPWVGEFDGMESVFWWDFD